MSTSKDYYQAFTNREFVCWENVYSFWKINDFIFISMLINTVSLLLWAPDLWVNGKQNSMGDFFISSCYLNNSLFFIPRLLSSCVVQAIKAGHKNDQRIWNCTLMSVIFVETFSNWKCKNKLVGYILKTSCFKTIKIMTLFRPILTISVSFLFFKVLEHHKDFFFFLR